MRRTSFGGLGGGLPGVGEAVAVCVDCKDSLNFPIFFKHTFVHYSSFLPPGSTFQTQNLFPLRLTLEYFSSVSGFFHSLKISVPVTSSLSPVEHQWISFTPSHTHTYSHIQYIFQSCECVIKSLVSWGFLTPVNHNSCSRSNHGGLD